MTILFSASFILVASPRYKQKRPTVSPYIVYTCIHCHHLQYLPFVMHGHYSIQHNILYIFTYITSIQTPDSGTQWYIASYVSDSLQQIGLAYKFAVALHEDITLLAFIHQLKSAAAVEYQIYYYTGDISGLLINLGIQR